VYVTGDGDGANVICWLLIVPTESFINAE
jgi:hypothetical protein